MNRKQHNSIRKDFAEKVIVPFQQARLERLQAVRLSDLLEQFSPFLLTIVPMATADAIICTLVNVYVASQEQSIFDKLVKDFAYLPSDDFHVPTPLDEAVRLKDSAFKMAYIAKLNELTYEFLVNFTTTDHEIDWLKLADLVSQREGGKMSLSSKNN